MADYAAALKYDLAEQFKDEPNIEALMDVIGAELQEVSDFYQQLLDERSVSTSVGVQLDGVGDIAVLSRKEAGILAGEEDSVEVLDDDTYRHYLLYKIFKNSCNCTYPDIMKAARMFWDLPLYYSEDIDIPATMILDTGEISSEYDIGPLMEAPILRAAGVTFILYITTRTDIETTKTVHYGTANTLWSQDGMDTVLTLVGGAYLGTFVLGEDVLGDP